FATSEIESFVSRKRGGVTAWTMLVWDSATTIK
ncbi:outer membrane protease, partial [Sinorhizobium meliloti]